LVRAAFFAEALRADADRRRAALLAWLDSAFFVTALRPSRFGPRVVADVRGAGGSFTPARRALASPIAIACFVDPTPCFPSRTWWISSRTKAPACVDADRPLRFALRARSSVAFSGMQSSGIGTQNQKSEIRNQKSGMA
jgi:hypothetical protein